MDKAERNRLLRTSTRIRRSRSFLKFSFFSIFPLAVLLLIAVALVRANYGQDLSPRLLGYGYFVSLGLSYVLMVIWGWTSHAGTISREVKRRKALADEGFVCWIRYDVWQQNYDAVDVLDVTANGSHIINSAWVIENTPQENAFASMRRDPGRNGGDEDTFTRIDDEGHTVPNQWVQTGAFWWGPEDTQDVTAAHKAERDKNRLRY